MLRHAEGRTTSRSYQNLNTYALEPTALVEIQTLNFPEATNWLLQMHQTQESQLWRTRGKFRRCLSHSMITKQYGTFSESSNRTSITAQASNELWHWKYYHVAVSSNSNVYDMKYDKTVSFKETTPLYFSPYTADVSPRNMVFARERTRVRNVWDWSPKLIIWTWGRIAGKTEKRT